jgi:hypothetical protein
MPWCNLPHELEELIFAKLSVVESARVSRTCRAFQAAFCRQMAREQKHRCDLAVTSFGHERIACIASLADRFLKGQRMHPALDEQGVQYSSIGADGTLRVKPKVGQPLTSTTRLLSCKPEDLLVEFWFDYLPPPSMRIVIRPTEGGWVELRCEYSAGRLGSIAVCPCGDEDVEGLALIQALLSGWLAPTSHDHYLSLCVHVQRYNANRGVYTTQGLQAQIAPLLPFASRYTFEGRVQDAQHVFKHHARPWIRSSGANKESTLSVMVFP